MDADRRQELMERANWHEGQARDIRRTVERYDDARRTMDTLEVVLPEPARRAMDEALDRRLDDIVAREYAREAQELER